MKNKKGILLAEETLKIIIALISIGFLAYFLGALYFSSTEDKELEQAEASLKHLVDEIERGNEEVIIFNPKDWLLISWPFKDENKFPDSCNGRDCVCIFKSPNIAEQVSGLIESDVTKVFLEHSEEGVCLENTKKLVVKKNGAEQQPIVIEPLLKLKIADNIISKNES